MTHLISILTSFTYY